MAAKTSPAILAGALLIPLMAPTLAQAQTMDPSAQRAYLGLNVGSAEQDLRLRGLGSTDDSNTGFKLYGGYGFNQHFGLEAGYLDLGKARIGSRAAASSATAEPQSLYLAGTGRWPISEQFSVFAKAGIGYHRTKLRTTVAGFTDRSTDKRVAALYGVGAEYNFSQNLSAVAEYEDFRKVADDGGAEVRADMFSLGIRYKFD